MATDVVASPRGRIFGNRTAPAFRSQALNGSIVEPAALHCHNLSKSFGDTRAVHDFSLEVPQGQVVALLGPSGCGKTTVLRLIAGFENPDEGTVTVGGQCVFQPRRNLPPEKRRVGMVFQEGALFPHLTVAQNVAYGLPRGDQRKVRVQEVLTLVGLENLGHRMPHQLSGGQQQRVALARALAPQPQLLLLDEPFSNLDPGLRDQVRRDVLEIIRNTRVTAIFVTHDQEEALFIGDTIAVMREGRVEQVDSPEEIFHHPATRFVAEFIGTVDFLPAWRSGDRLTTEIGSMSWPQGCPDDGRLEVMVRPDCLDCQPWEEGPAVIASREFRGAFYLYQLALPSGSRVRCLLPHTQEYPVGSRVAVDLRCGHSLRPFIDGRAIGN
jgi:iron(III) transport system ATP-binding protein